MRLFRCLTLQRTTDVLSKFDIVFVPVNTLAHWCMGVIDFIHKKLE